MLNLGLSDLRFAKGLVPINFGNDTPAIADSILNLLGNGAGVFCTVAMNFQDVKREAGLVVEDQVVDGRFTH